MSPNQPEFRSHSTMTVLQDVASPFVPGGVEVKTVLIYHPPGAPGYPPHRLPGGPGFGYMLSGEMLFEIDGQAPRVVRAGEAFWGPGGDVIHYRDANNRDDIACSFVLTLICEPGKPMIEWVTEAEVLARKRISQDVTDRRDTTTQHGEKRASHWRETTRELVLTAATATVAADFTQGHGNISVTVTGQALSSDLLLADTGAIALTSLSPAATEHPMNVVPVRLDTLSDVPAIHVVGENITASTHLRLTLELTARRPYTGVVAVLTCAAESLLLDPGTPEAVIDFQPHQARPLP